MIVKRKDGFGSYEMLTICVVLIIEKLELKI